MTKVLGFNINVVIVDELPLRKLGEMFDGWCKNNGLFKLPSVLILREHKDNEDLVNDELEHCRQVIITLHLHFWLYNKFDWYKMWAERKALTAQGFTPEQIEDALKRY